MTSVTKHASGLMRRRSGGQGLGRGRQHVATSGALEIDAELAQFDDCRPAPADRVRRKRERDGHPILLAERLAVAEDVVVPGRRLDGEAGGLEPADEFADVFPQLTVCRPAVMQTTGRLR